MRTSQLVLSRQLLFLTMQLYPRQPASIVDWTRWLSRRLSMKYCPQLQVLPACEWFNRFCLHVNGSIDVFLTSVDDVCPNQIYNCPARNLSFIMEIIHLLVSIHCPNSGKYSSCAQIPNRMQNSTLPLLGAFCEPFQFSTLNRPK